MHRTERTFVLISTLLMGLVLSRFAISKLTAWEISVQAFIEMARPLGLDPTLFRITTGILILIVFLSYLVTAFLTVAKNKLKRLQTYNYYNFTFLANVLGLMTMVGALLAEFFLREQPKWLLVYIAIGIILCSAINVWLTINKTSFNLAIVKSKINA